MPKSKKLLREEAEKRQEFYDSLQYPIKLQVIKSRRGESKKELRRIYKKEGKDFRMLDKEGNQWELL